MQIENTGLADVLDFSACCADLGLLEATACSRVPSENSEWTSADLADFSLTVLSHTDVRIGSETCFAKDGRFGFFSSCDVGAEFAVCRPSGHSVEVPMASPVLETV